MSLESILAKFSPKYLQTEHQVLNMILGINGSITSELVLGTFPYDIRDMIDKSYAPHILAVRHRKWESIWGELIETWCPDYMEEVLSGLGGGDGKEMKAELNVWNENGDGIGLIVRIEKLGEYDADLEDFGDLEDDGDFEVIKAKGMDARGWKILEKSSRKRPYEEAEDENDRDYYTSDEYDEEEDEEDTSMGLFVDPSKVDLYTITMETMELCPASD